MAETLLEDLLKEVGWVRRLAASLASPDAADDLAQDAVVAALRQRSPWLQR